MTVETAPSIQLQGIPASPGIRIGRAQFFDAHTTAHVPRTVPARQIDAQIKLLAKALESAEGEIRELRQNMSKRVDEAHASIFDPHLLFVRDPQLREKATLRIRDRQESAYQALMYVIREIAAKFTQMEDAYIRSRATDIMDVGKRIAKHLASGESTTQRFFASDAVVFAHDLTPSDTAQMDDRQVRAFATEVGGPTSHTAILARAMEIPAVVGLGPVRRKIESGMNVLIDGYAGTVTLNPSEDDIRKARNRRRRYLTRERDFRKLADLPAETIDGYRMDLRANLEFPREVDHILANGAQGIGLFRTEFLYLGKRALPTEEEQYAVYKDVVEKIAPETVIFRTLDIGGDKLLSTGPQTVEPNPFLGLRAIRYCLKHPDIFKTQLRALLRTSQHGPIKIMFPLVTALREVHQAKQLLNEVRKELMEEGITVGDSIEVGVMIEIPAAALIADQLAEEVDFLSIGTNDLIQYVLAVDRANERVASLYEPFHPAVLRLIRIVIDAAHRAGILVTVCGEMAANPRTALLLLGMGVDELSMGALSIPAVKFTMRHVRLAEARKLAQQATALATPAEIRDLVETTFRDLEQGRMKKRRPQPETVASK